MSTLPPLVLTETERAELQRRVRAHTTAQRDVTRARIVLLAACWRPMARPTARSPGWSAWMLTAWAAGAGGSSASG